jgi:hypothetical protein
VNIKSLPNSFFKEERDYLAFHDALLRVGCFSREMGDVMTLTMDKLCKQQDMSKIHIDHWDSLVDPDSRIIRNILRVGKDGKPVSRSTSYDLLNYLSLCLQFVDDRYAEHVDAWCFCKVMCVDDDDEE